MTNQGARTMLGFFLTEESIESWERLAVILPLIGVPPHDLSLSLIDEYPVSFGFDPEFIIVQAEDWSSPVVQNGRVICQVGPPALQFESPSALTVYGYVATNGGDTVLWWEQFETPQMVGAGGIVSILPYFSLSNECPPLGGCE